jgi:hypothetical protein
LWVIESPKTATTPVARKAKAPQVKKAAAPATKKTVAAAAPLKPIKGSFTKASLTVHLAERAGVEPKAAKALMAALEETVLASVHKKGAKEFTLPGLLKVVAQDLKSAEFGTVLGLCGQSEHLEGVRVRPFGDEFREEIGFGAIHEKFGQALS